MAVLTDQQIESRVTRRVLLITAAFVPFAATINALSLITEASRAVRYQDIATPWILEFTSAAVLLPLVLLLALFERFTPSFSDSWLQAVLFHLAGSVMFSLLHDLGMWSLRQVIFSAAAGHSYNLLPAGWTDLLYEYRKDILPYAVVILLLRLTRSIEEARRETAIAGSEARHTGRIALRSGGKTVFFHATEFEFATAAGNYVELHTADTTSLIRMTLSRLEFQLSASGMDVVRVSRSLLLNRLRIAEVAPMANGDLRIKLTDGSTTRGSRRYRTALNARAG